MTVSVLAGTPAAQAVDWEMNAGSDFTLPLLWTKNGAPVNLTGAVVTIDFGAAPRNGKVPAVITAAGANAEGATVTLGDGTGAANMTVFIPAATTALYAFVTTRYALWVTYPGSGTLRWAEGSVSFDDAP